MARTLVLTMPKSFGTLCYAVDRAVGPGQPNLRDDVLLVQFFLRVLGPRPIENTSESFLPPAQQNLAIDGMFADRTRDAIRTFQSQFNKTAPGLPASDPFRLLTDGVVDSLANGALVGPRQGHVFTIIRLNTEYAFQFGLERHKRLGLDPLFPRELFNKLFLRTE